MTSIAALNPLFEENNIDPQTIIYLLKEGIQLERLKLEVKENTESETLQTFNKIMEGERFLTILISARFG
jgi:hypothetical protein